MGDVIHLNAPRIISCPECGGFYWIVYENSTMACADCSKMCMLEIEDAEDGSPGTDKAS